MSLLRKLKQRRADRRSILGLVNESARALGLSRKDTRRARAYALNPTRKPRKRPRRPF